MATLVRLPTELLAHILHFSTDGQTAELKQQSRFSFGLVARALFLASTDDTTFYVAGEKQAKALIAKLEREKKWAAQEERKAKSGRTTRLSTLSITRVSRVRRLGATVSRKTGWMVLAKLLLATPDVVVLELDIYPTR